MRVEVIAGVVSSFSGRRSVLACEGGEESIVLNPTGTLLWGYLDSKKAVDSSELVELLLESYSSISGETARGDVVKFLEKLHFHRLVSLAS